MRRVILLFLTFCAVLLPRVDALALDVLVNQVGFEPNSPKAFRVQRATDYAGDGTFSVKRVSDNAEVYAGSLTRKGGLWDKWYWQGDFSSYQIPGEYYISAAAGGETNTSYNFNISPGYLLDKTGKLAYQYFLTQRCGTSVSVQYQDCDGNTINWSHNACHLDDGYLKPDGPQLDEVGGWHDAGDYNKFPHGFGANGVFDLLWLYESNKTYYDAIDANANNIPDIIEEARHQARWLVKMVQPSGHIMGGTQIRRSGPTWVRPENDTDNVIGNSDDRWITLGDEGTPQETVCSAALIKMHRVLASKGLPTENFAQKALDIWNHRVAIGQAGGHNNLGAGAHQIWAGLDLYAVFGQQNCWDRAVQRIDDLSGPIISNPAFYDNMIYCEGPGYELGVLAWFARTYPQTAQAANARTAVQALMDHYINYLASPQIGLMRRVDTEYGGGQLLYFPTNSDWNGFFCGINRLYLVVLFGAVESYKLIGDPAYLKFALDQYDWVMGANYNRICMMEAAGDNNLNKYHSRYDTFIANGVQPGVVPNGYVRVYSTGLPNMDLTGARYQTNEGWLINSAAYAIGLSAFTVFTDSAQIVSDTIPSVMYTGRTYSVSVVVKNTGYIPWTFATGYKLGAVDDSDPFAPGRADLAGGDSIGAGQQKTFTFTMTAPATTGTYTTDWRMVHEQVCWFGDTLAKQVQVFDSAPPAAVVSLTATPGDQQVALSWVNPSSANFTGTMIRWKINSYPSSITDGSIVVDKPNVPGSTDSYVQISRTNGMTFCYRAFSHNDIPAYNTASSVTATAVPAYDPLWLNETFNPYTNGNLGGQGNWTTQSGTTSAQVESAFVPTGGVRAVLLDSAAAGGSIKNHYNGFNKKSFGYQYVSFDVAQDYTGDQGVKFGSIYVYADNSSTEIARVDCMSGRWMLDHGDGSAFIVSSVTPNTWYNIKIGFDMPQKKLDCWVNGIQIASNYSFKGTGTNIAKITVATDRQAALSVQKLYVDNIRGETRPAAPTTLTDDGVYTGSLTKLHCSWSAVTGATQYRYAIGTTPGGTNIRNWTSNGAPTDVSATELSLVENQTYYFSAMAGNAYGTWGPSTNSNGISTATGVNIQQAKALNDGQIRAIRDKVVSAAFSGYFYIQEQDKPFGIMAVSSATVSPGQLVDVAGPIGGADSERFIYLTGNAVNFASGPGSPPPIAIGNSALGGVALNDKTPGITGGVGLNNIGLLVRTGGRVTEVDPSGNYFRISDGSKQIKILSESLAEPSGEPYVVVTGICARDASDGEPRAAVRPRTQADIAEF
ncbi:MAG: glycoside hydrolase family 9 protein [Armatimonadota bacterium]|nr:glycoside hydrolase family 9 protein [Armatimonadota bacterium]